MNIFRVGICAFLDYIINSLLAPMGWLLLAGGVHLVFLFLEELSNLRMEEADAARTVYEMSVVK